MELRDCDWRVIQDPACSEHAFVRGFFIASLSATILGGVLLTHTIIFRVSQREKKKEKKGKKQLEKKKKTFIKLKY